MLWLVIAASTVLALVIMGERKLAWDLFLLFAILFGIVVRIVTHA